MTEQVNIMFRHLDPDDFNKLISKLHDRDTVGDKMDNLANLSAEITRAFDNDNVKREHELRVAKESTASAKLSTEFKEELDRQRGQLRKITSQLAHVDFSRHPGAAKQLMSNYNQRSGTPSSQVRRPPFTPSSSSPA